MVYFGKTVRLSSDLTDMRDDVKVFQQHCGGENLCVYKGKLHEGGQCVKPGCVFWICICKYILTDTPNHSEWLFVPHHFCFRNFPVYFTSTQRLPVQLDLLPEWAAGGAAELLLRVQTQERLTTRRQTRALWLHRRRGGLSMLQVRSLQKL